MPDARHQQPYHLWAARPGVCERGDVVSPRQLLPASLVSTWTRGGFRRRPRFPSYNHTHKYCGQGKQARRNRRVPNAGAFAFGKRHRPAKVGRAFLGHHRYPSRGAAGGAEVFKSPLSALPSRANRCGRSNGVQMGLPPTESPLGGDSVACACVNACFLACLLVLRTSERVCVCACVRACMFVLACARARACLRACVYVRAGALAVCEIMRAYARVSACARVRACVRARMRV